VRLTLSFDNGPWPDATPRILDILQRRRIRASFFLVGERLADPAARSAAERAKDEGHWIGNHTMTHSGPLGVMDDPSKAEHEISDAQAALGDLSHPNRFFRPPGKGRLGPHMLNRPIVDYLAENRYTIVTWNNVPRDWEGEGWIARALEGLNAYGWSLLVLHDHHLASMMHTLEAFLDQVTDRLEIVQDFPDACVPMRKGKVQSALAGLLAGA
jgi:peptidoglycan/xylan/chitin deacetylase (PgdA/CDA1 family)